MGDIGPLAFLAFLKENLADSMVLIWWQSCRVSSSVAVEDVYDIKKKSPCDKTNFLDQA